MKNNFFRCLPGNRVDSPQIFFFTLFPRFNPLVWTPLLQQNVLLGSLLWCLLPFPAELTNLPIVISFPILLALSCPQIHQAPLLTNRLYLPENQVDCLQIFPLPVFPRAQILQSHLQLCCTTLESHLTLLQSPVDHTDLLPSDLPPQMCCIVPDLNSNKHCLLTSRAISQLKVDTHTSPTIPKSQSPIFLGRLVTEMLL